MPAGTGPLAWVGMIVFPAMILLMILRQSGPVRKFRDAGATSAATARRPGSIAITTTDRLHLPALVRRGVLVDVGDGRLYLDVARHRRRRARRALAGVLAAGAVAALGAWLATR